MRQPQYVPFDNPGEVIQSLLVVNPTTIIAGGMDGEIWFSNNMSIWSMRQALPEGTWVTDIELGSNGDLLVAGVITTGTNINKVAIARSIAATTNVGYAVWTTATVTSVKDVSPFISGVTRAYVAPAADYATSGTYYYSAENITTVSGGYTGGVFQSGTTGGRTDNDVEWYIAGDLTGTPAGVTGLVTSAGGPGFTAEGTGMVYAVPGDIRYGSSTSKNGVLRIKGKVSSSTYTSRAEMIASPSGVNLYNLWVGPSAVGNTTLTAFGDDCNIYQYTDTINKAVTGLKATASITAVECEVCPPYQGKLVITWDAMANANYYFVVVDDATSWVNVYDAAEAAEPVPTVDYGMVVSTNSATVTGLLTDTKYNISVWALKYTGSGTYTMAGASPEYLETKFLTSFGMGISVSTPPAPVGSLSPAAAATNIPIRPTFQWAAVNGAISYTLQVSTADTFATLVAPTPVTVTGTAYAWPSTATALSYGTTYYWRVLATTASGAGPWATNVFTTLAATPSQLPAVIVTAAPSQAPITLLPPVVTVNIPPQVTPTVILPSIVFPAQPTPVINLPAPIVNIPQA